MFVILIVRSLQEEAVVAEWFDAYKDPEVRKLAMGRLLNSISLRMHSKADKGDRDPLKIAIHTCHDTSLAGLCQTLDVFDGRCVLNATSTLLSI
jgi:acid phosphatase